MTNRRSDCIEGDPSKRPSSPEVVGWDLNRYVDGGNSTPVINDDSDGTVIVTDGLRGKQYLEYFNITT